MKIRAMDVKRSQAGLIILGKRTPKSLQIVKRFGHKTADYSIS